MVAGDIQWRRGTSESHRLGSLRLVVLLAVAIRSIRIVLLIGKVCHDLCFNCRPEKTFAVVSSTGGRRRIALIDATCYAQSSCDYSWR
jgi:hypothetical protein